MRPDVSKCIEITGDLFATAQSLNVMTVEQMMRRKRIFLEESSQHQQTTMSCTVAVSVKAEGYLAPAAASMAVLL